MPSTPTRRDRISPSQDLPESPSTPPSGDAAPATPPGGHLATPLEAALALEPELRTLHGVLVALRHLGERADPIDPAAIAVLAAAGEGALREVSAICSDMQQGTGSPKDMKNA